MALGDIGSYEGFAYRLAMASGSMAAGLAAASPVFSFRNHSAKPVRILAVELNAAVGATGFTAGSSLFEIVVARAFTASDSGGTSAAFTQPKTGALRTSQNTSIINSASGNIQIATTGTLTAGTRTLDTQALGNIVAPAGTAGTTMVADIPLYVDWSSYGIPLVLAQDEGFIIRATVPATGVWQFGVNTAWVEASA